MRALPPLNALRAFEVSGRHLNFRLAAEELGVTQGAVAQQVRSLESHLGFKLFERQARGLALTNEGRSYLQPLRRAFDMIVEATENLSPGDRVVTISTTPSFATRWLVPRLGQFSLQYPDIRLRLDASNTLSNFQSDGVDVAIRLGPSTFGAGLVADPLFDAEVVPVCHPDLTQGDHAIRAPRDLLGQVLLEDSHGRWPVFLEVALGDEAAAAKARVMNFSQTSLAVEAAIAGQGVALCPRALIAEDLQQGRLCQPLALSLATGEGYFVVAPRAPRQPALVAVARDWLLAQGALVLDGVSR